MKLQGESNTVWVTKRSGNGTNLRSPSSILARVNGMNLEGAVLHEAADVMAKHEASSPTSLQRALVLGPCKLKT